MIDLGKVILNAKLGSARKDAQEDTCLVFAVALRAVLEKHDVMSSIYTATYWIGNSSRSEWSHSVIEFNERHYDSMGEFSVDIHRHRSKIHPNVKSRITYELETGIDLIDDEFIDLYAFYIEKLEKSLAAELRNLIVIEVATINETLSP